MWELKKDYYTCPSSLGISISADIQMDCKNSYSTGIPSLIPLSFLHMTTSPVEGISPKHLNRAVIKNIIYGNDLQEY